MAEALVLGHGNRILVADDDPIFVEMCRGVLALARFDVVGAGDGLEAITRLQSENFDLAIVDLSMPRIDGFRLIALIRAMPRFVNLPILVITSRTDPTAIEEGYRVGANDYMTKPIIWPQLPARVVHLIESSYPVAPAMDYMEGDEAPIKADGTRLS